MSSEEESYDSASDSEYYSSDASSDFDYYEAMDEALMGGDADFVDEFFANYYWQVTSWICGGILMSFLEKAAHGGHPEVIKRLRKYVSKESEYLVRDEDAWEMQEKCIRITAAANNLEACLKFIQDSKRWDDEKKDYMIEYIREKYRMAYNVAKEKGHEDFCRRLIEAARPGRVLVSLPGLLRREMGIRHVHLQQLVSFGRTRAGEDD
jgi:hypothetical protein